MLSLVKVFINERRFFLLTLTFIWFGLYLLDENFEKFFVFLSTTDKKLSFSLLILKQTLTRVLFSFVAMIAVENFFFKIFPKDLWLSRSV